MSPDDWRFEDANGRTWEEVAERLRRQYWWPLRRALLDMGVTGDVYLTERARFWRQVTEHHKRWWPCRMVPTTDQGRRELEEIAATLPPRPPRAPE